MSGPTQVPTSLFLLLTYRAFTLYCSSSHKILLNSQRLIVGPTTPRIRNPRFGLFPFRSPLLGESLLISLPPLTEMSHFSGCRSYILCIEMQVIEHYLYRVSPFGYLRIKASYQLPGAFRRLVRPSSPFDAKTSTNSPY